LKQLGLACHNYATLNGVFPPGSITWYVVGSNPNPWTEAGSGYTMTHGTSWILFILPYIEQGAIYDRWDFSRNVAGNPALAQRDVGLLYCPSRRRTVRGEDRAIMFSRWGSGGTDYGGCFGNGNYWSGAGDPPCDRVMWNSELIKRYELGVFTLNESTSFADIRDGASNTLLTGEMQRLHESKLPYPATCHGISADGWAVGGCSSGFDTDGPPESPGGINNDFFESAGSEHPGGASLGLADGSVQWYSENMSDKIFSALGSKQGREVP